MTWSDPRTRRAKLIKKQDEDKTPSMVVFGEDETLLGELAHELVEIRTRSPRRGSKKLSMRTVSLTSLTRRLPKRESFAYLRPDQPIAGSMVADMEPAQRGMCGSGPKAWIWSRFSSACSRFVVATITRPVVCTSIAIR